MQRVSVRELSGKLVTKLTDGTIMGVTHSGALVGVLVPWTTEIKQRLARYDAADTAERIRREQDAAIAPDTPGDIRELLDARTTPSLQATFSRISIRELKGERLVDAARAGEKLVVTVDRAAVALFLPVDDDWVERLVEASISRFMGDSTAGDPAEVRRRVQEPASNEVLAVSTSVRYPGEQFRRQRAIGIRIIGDARDGEKRLVGVVADGLADIVVPLEEIPLASLDEDHVFAQILSLVDILRTRMDDSEELIGVGVEIGGHVDKGRVIRSANATWDHFPLAERLSSSLQLPVMLENDANSLALYETDFRGVDDDYFALVLLTGLGVGGGLVLGGQLYRGSLGMAGELGHVPVEADSLVKSDVPALPQCRCGNVGCLESVATPHAIETLLEKSGFSDGYQAALRQPDDEIVKKVFSRAGAGLGRAIAMVLNLVNPSSVVIYGPSDLVGIPRRFHIESQDYGPGATGTYLGAMVAAIRIHTFSNGAEECKFIVRPSHDDQGARAAAACLIHHIRDLPVMQRLGGLPNAHGRARYGYVG
jgi:predicted NBD/HSP70 family sugar kinase/antitoxin (DNA-binding transcriptional repressor) of toxin-antitoxin stability system